MSGYKERLLEVMKYARQGSLSVAHVVHDDDCAIWTTKRCTCDPDITIENVDESG